MRTLKTAIAAALITTTLSAAAAPLGQMLLPSPISVAITVGQWIIKDRKKVYYIQVRSSAQDRHQAIQAGYKLAVEQALGALSLSTVEIRNQAVVRNEIIVASAGYVEDSRVVSERQLGNAVEVILDVWVTESRIADRFLAESRGSGRIDGNRFADTLDSYNHSVSTTTRAVESVLVDYPHRAYDVKVNAKMGRDGTLVLPTTVKWNNDYVFALWEALKNAGPLVPCNNGATNYDSCPEREKIRMRYPGQWFGTNMSEFGFNNPSILNAVRTGLEQRYPVYRILTIHYKLETVTGQQSSVCRQLHLGGIIDYNQKQIYLDSSRTISFEYSMPGLSSDYIRSLNTVSAEIKWGTGRTGC